MDNIKENITLGEKRVRVSFNVTGNSAVNDVKIAAAKSIDALEALRKDETGVLVPSEKQRLISMAQTAYEEAANWDVKVLTFDL